MIQVATASNVVDGLYETNRKRVQAAGLKFTHHWLDPFTWDGLVDWEYEFASSHPDDIVCFVDATDFFFQAGTPSIETVLGDRELLFHSEAVCWPEPHKADFFGYSPTKFRFLNGTGPCGRGSAIAKAIEYGKSHFPIRSHSSNMYADNDQRFWTDVHLSGIGHLDHRCELSVAMNAVQRDEFEVVNKQLVLPSGVVPVFVHFNGHSRVLYRDVLEKLL